MCESATVTQTRTDPAGEFAKVGRCTFCGAEKTERHVLRGRTCNTPPRTRGKHVTVQTLSLQWSNDLQLHRNRLSKRNSCSAHNLCSSTSFVAMPMRHRESASAVRTAVPGSGQHTSCSLASHISRHLMHVARHEEMEQWEENEVDGKLPQNALQLTKESDARRHPAASSGHEKGEISERESRQLQSAEEDVERSFVVQQHVQLMQTQHCVVWLHHCVGHLWQASRLKSLF